MGRGPEAASGELVEAAFAVRGAQVCEELPQGLRARVWVIVREAREGGTPAVGARARKLLGVKRG